MTQVAENAVSAGLHAALDTALSADLDALAPADLVSELRALGAVANRLAAVQARVLAAVEQRRLEGGFGGSKTTSDLLCAAQPVTGRQARDSVDLALSLTSGRTLTGEALTPIAPLTAAALTEGRVGVEQARVIVETLDRTPHWLTPDDVEVVERLLLEAAGTEHPAALRRTAEALLARLDQDGPEPTEAAPPRARRLRIVRRRGGVRLIVELDTAEEELVRSVLDPLAAPRPSQDGQQPDPRSASEREHDALIEALQRVLRCGSMPTAGGAPVTVLATVTLAELLAGRGVARAQHGASWPLPDLLGHVSEAEIVPIVTDKWGAVLCLGRSIRLATVLQRRALAARDGGCSFPGCTRPPSWTQVHHVIEWEFGGRTDVDNMCLLCAYHHRHFADLGWQVVMTGGVPRWIPPAWLDPDRRPVRNTAHHPPEADFLRRAGRPPDDGVG